MADRDEFAKLLYRIHFTNYDTKEYAEAQFQDARAWIKSNIPSKLYHYRRCSEYSLDALEKNEIWGSSIMAFNDPFECMPCYQIEQLQNALDIELSEESLQAILPQMREGCFPTGLSSMISPDTAELLSQRLKSMPNDDVIRAGFAQFRKTLFAYINHNLNKFEVDFFNQIMLAEKLFHITCLSETNTSSLMWGHYADSHKGFCLEYDFSTVLGDCHRDCTDIRNCPGFMMNYALAPVVYSQERFNATSGLYSLVMNSLIEEMKIPVQKYYPDMFMPIKTLLTKSADWQYEKEWRLFKSPAEQFQKHCCMTRLKPSAVYLGINMADDHKSRIIQICKEQNIPCFQMIPNYFSSAYEIRSVEQRIVASCK